MSRLRDMGARAAAVLRRFACQTDGAASALALVFFIVTAMIGGLAIDSMNITRTRTIMQVAADTTAHAAMYYRGLEGEQSAKQKALPIGQTAVPSRVYGAALTLSDIEFGFWTPETLTFSPSQGSETAVRVTVTLHEQRDNALRTFLLRLIGKNSFNLSVSSVYVGRIEPCFSQGFVARERIDIRSNNTYVRNFCIHSNDYVEFNNNNYFEPGVVVSMPDINDLWIPGSGFSKNPGLQEALRSNQLNFGIVDAIPTIINGLDVGDPAYAPDYLTSTAVVNLNSKKLKKNDFREGRLHRLMCSGSGKVTIPTGTTLRNAVVVSNCEIKFGRNILLRDAIIATSSTSARSFNGSSGVSVGYNDNCQAGGGAKLITMGGMQFPSKLQIYGSQLLAAQDIVFAAQGNGVHGASFIAGGEISGTSNMVFGTCDSRVDDPYGLPVPRMVN